MSKNAMQDFATAFGVVLEDEVLEDETELEETFFLWDTNEILFNIYKIVRNYLDESYKLSKCQTIIIELAKAYSANVKDVLQDIIYIHYGYLEVIIDSQKNSTSNEE